jgi:hypothetical protein
VFTIKLSTATPYELGDCCRLGKFLKHSLNARNALFYEALGSLAVNAFVVLMFQNSLGRPKSMGAVADAANCWMKTNRSGAP